MIRNRKRRGILFKALTIAIVCLFAVNTLSWADAGSQTFPSNTLNVQSMSQPHMMTASAESLREARHYWGRVVGASLSIAEYFFRTHKKDDESLLQHLETVMRLELGAVLEAIKIDRIDVAGDILVIPFTSYESGEEEKILIALRSKTSPEKVPGEAVEYLDEPDDKYIIKHLRLRLDVSKKFQQIKIKRKGNEQDVLLMPLKECGRNKWAVAVNLTWPFK